MKPTASFFMLYCRSKYCAISGFQYFMAVLIPKFAPFMPLPPADMMLARQPAADALTGRELFSSGRDAILRILHLEKIEASRRVFLPHFFCPQLVKIISGKCEVGFYEDLPSETFPRFETLAPKRGDIVIAVNFFGLRNRSIWETWAKPEGVLLAEDHSHAPFSDRALSSRADYAFASLRKCLPLPDGAWLKSKGRKAAKMFLRGGGMEPFAADSLSLAAVLERQSGAEAAETARALFYESEAKLNAKTSFSRISGYSCETLRRLDVEKTAAVRSANFEAFCGAMDGLCGVRIMNFGTAENPRDVYCPALKFDIPKMRDIVYSALRGRGVFASIYWGGLGKNASPAARRESDTTFVLPLDFRHTQDDAVMLADIVRRACADCK